MLREAGAAEVHVRISSPPVKWPCFYGIDFASRAELIATGLNTEEICRSIGADSLGYVSLDGLVAATRVGKDQLCRACFDGVYPVELPLSERLGKSILEDAGTGVPRNGVRSDVDGLETVTAGAGAADALTRP
jgi:amidophosphoribosyltransferase